MKFKEDFPSLKDFDLDCSDIIADFAQHSLVESVIKRVQLRIEEQIKQHLLDKQKVIEKIDEIWLERRPDWFDDRTKLWFLQTRINLLIKLGFDIGDLYGK